MQWYFSYRNHHRTTWLIQSNLEFSLSPAESIDLKVIEKLWVIIARASVLQKAVTSKYLGFLFSCRTQNIIRLPMALEQTFMSTLKLLGGSANYMTVKLTTTVCVFGSNWFFNTVVV